jgi:hypothetical protein
MGSILGKNNNIEILHKNFTKINNVSLQKYDKKITKEIEEIIIHYNR